MNEILTALGITVTFFLIFFIARPMIGAWDDINKRLSDNKSKQEQNKPQNLQEELEQYKSSEKAKSSKRNSMRRH